MTDDRAVADRGFALVVTTILMGLVLAFSITLLDVTISSRRASKYVEQTDVATQLAEAGIHKAIYCLKAASGANCGGAYGDAYPGEANVGFASGTFTVFVTGEAPDKTLTSTGTTASGVTQTVRTKVSINAPSRPQPGFDYAVQASDMGVELENNATVDGGAVYTDSDVICGNNAEVNYDIYVSKSGGKIDNCDGVLDAHADRILSSKVLGDAYYRTHPADIAGTNVTGAKFANQPTPATQDMPVFDKAFWEDVAESGGVHHGDYVVTNNQEIDLGPIRIVGDLTLDNNVIATLQGPVWVEGNVTLGNNVTVQLASGFGTSSGVIIADDPADTANGGLVDISNNAEILGSGTDGSYVLVYTTNTRISDASPAIKVANNADGGVFFAPDGSVRIHNNGSAIAAIGRRVYLDNNAAIAYDDDGASPSDMVIATAASGVWRFLQGAWYQFK